MKSNRRWIIEALAYVMLWTLGIIGGFAIAPESQYTPTIIVSAWWLALYISTLLKVGLRAVVLVSTLFVIGRMSELAITGKWVLYHDPPETLSAAFLALLPQVLFCCSPIGIAAAVNGCAPQILRILVKTETCRSAKLNTGLFL